MGKDEQPEAFIAQVRFVCRSPLQPAQSCGELIQVRGKEGDLGLGSQRGKRIQTGM